MVSHRSTDHGTTLTVDTAVIGLGIMGAAVLSELALRGQRVCGLERFDIPHAFGSSHGGSRVIRKAYYEDPAYVPLLEESWSSWQALEEEAGERLLLPTGGLHFGPADSPELNAVLSAVETFGLAYEVPCVRDLEKRFPQFRLASGDLAILEQDAGVLLPERCVTAFVRRAIHRGAEVFARTRLTRLALTPEAIILEIEGPQGVRRIECGQVVMALGPWWPDAPLECPLSLKVTRQVQLWFDTEDPSAFLPERFPIFMRYAGAGEDRPLVYGLPEATFPGLKIAVHAPGETTRADEVDRALRPQDLEVALDFARRHLSGVSDRVLGARTCLYSMSPDGHFGLGRHPEDPRVLCALGFSGHGFKLAPSVGRILADLATAGTAVPGLFALDRFDQSRLAP